MKRYFFEIIYRPNSILRIGDYSTNQYFTHEELANFYIQYYTDFPHKYYVKKIEAEVFNSVKEQNERLERLKCLGQKVEKLKKQLPNDTEVINEEIKLNNAISMLEEYIANLNEME